MSIEEPTFATTLQDGAFEVREYPAPIAAEVTVTSDRNPPTRFAVVTFSGLARTRDVAKKLAELRAFAAVHHLRADGPSSLVRYNPPWTPWFMRRNEVRIPLRADTVH